ncbi:MAG: protein kinase [Chloroflexota bacterium]
MGDLIGRVIAKYRLDALIGEGGMGTVYRAYDLNLDRPVAIKLMHSHFARQPEFRARLTQEAKAAAQLDHPSIVRIFDFGESEEGLYIAMEDVKGGNLRAHLQRIQSEQRFLPLKQALQIGFQIADALDYAHRRGLIHRDVKPGNIILKRLAHADEPGEQPFRAILTDFGLVRLVDGDRMTQSGTTLGTPVYMSPEQCRADKLDGRSDLYALGVVLYELFTNRPPFQFNSLSEALMAHLQGQMPPPLSRYRSDLPPMLEGLVKKALAKAPADRFADGAEMATTLRSALYALDNPPTQVVPLPEVGRELTPQPERPAYQLIITTPGHPPSALELRPPGVSLGRLGDNDVALPAEGISRHHARLVATETGWAVVDLGGVNGTLLDDQRLVANQPTPLPAGARLQIGPYTLTIQPVQAAITPPPAAARPPISSPAAGSALSGVERPTILPTPVPSALVMAVVPDSLSVEPGERSQLAVEVTNNGPSDDMVYVRIHGLPPSWVTIPQEPTRVAAGRTARINLLVQPPRRPTTPPGRQRFRVELVSQSNPGAEPAANASILIGSYEAFEVSLEPRQFTLPGEAQVTIRNTGNTAAEFSLVTRDPASELHFEGERGRLSLEPDKSEAIDLRVEARRSGLFSPSHTYPFQVEVTARSGAQQTLSAEVQTGYPIPPAFLYAAIFVVTFACILGLMYLILGRSPFGRAGTDGQVDFTATAAVAETITSVSVAQTSVANLAETATLVAATDSAATAAVLGDRDGDGLSDAQEAIVETNPDNPDSDSDGLTDGEEVLTHGSDPRNRDTDGDLLLDGDEVNRFKTRPTNPDSDGDGVRDGVEIDQGTDPLATPAMTPTPSWTPSATPLVSPSPTNTNTPSPTASQTAAPTATPTFTPSPSATPTPTPTASPTSEPNPALVCVETPPTLDGVFNAAEWGDTPLFTYSLEELPERLVEVYFVRDATQLYLAFRLHDTTDDVTDSLRLYVDTTRNEGDPDTADRFFQIGRDGTLTIQAGIGSNADGQHWDATYSSSNWTAVLGEPGTGEWVVEMAVGAAEVGALANPFGLMSQVLFTNEGLADWPAEAINTDAATWQDVDNVTCTP